MGIKLWMGWMAAVCFAGMAIFKPSGAGPFLAVVLHHEKRMGPRR